MGRTQIRYLQLADHTVTGASFRNEMMIWDETKSYSPNDIVWWKGRLWICKNNTSASQEGDLSKSPDNIPNDWEERTLVMLLKQKTISIQNIGDSVTITLSKPNLTNKQLVSIFKKMPPQSDVPINIATFSENIWQYDSDWVIQYQGVIKLKKSRGYDMTSETNSQSTNFYSKLIDSADYADIISVSVSMPN